MVIQEKIEKLVSETFSPEYIELINESHMHSVPPDSETHFKLVLVSSQFEGQRQVQRHQSVYRSVAELMNNPIHALALHTFSPEEWIEKEGVSVADSPNCMGGNGK